MFTDCRVTESTDGISLIKRISIWESIKKTWLIVDPISVENQIQLEHVSPSLWDLLDRQSFCRWMKVQLSTRWAAGKGRLGRRSREFWQFRVGAGWSSTVAGSVLHQAWLKRVGLLWVVSMFVFLSDATQVVVVANTTWAAVALWGIPTSAAQCSFQTPLWCWCCGGGGGNDDDDDYNGFFLQQDQNSDQFNYINFKQIILNITDTQALSDQISIPFILIQTVWCIWMDMLILSDGWFYFVNNKTWGLE